MIRGILLAVGGVLCAGGLIVRPAKATSASWNGSTDDWTNVAHWSTNPYYPNNGMPSGTDYDVSISAAGSGPYTIILDNPTGYSGTISLNSLTIDNANARLLQELKFGQTIGITLDLMEPSGGRGIVNIDAGTYDLGYDAVLSNAVLNVAPGATFVPGGGTLQNVVLGSNLNTPTATVQVANTISEPQGLDFNGHTITANQFYYQNAYDPARSSYVGQTVNGNLILKGDHPSLWAQSGDLTIGTGATVTVGSINGYMGGGISCNATLANEGTIVANEWDMSIGGVGGFANAGMVKVSSLTFLDAPFTNTNTGTLALSGANAVLDIAGGSLSRTGAFDWSNSGTIKADSDPAVAATEAIFLGGVFHPSDVGLASSGANATFTPNGAAVVIFGTLDNTGNTLRFQSSTGVWGLSPTGIILNGTLVADNQANGASYLNVEGGTLKNLVLGSDLTLTGDINRSPYATIANTASNPLGLDFNGHTVNINGQSMQLRYQDANDTVGDRINGNVNLTADDAQIQGGTASLTIDSDVTIAASSDTTNQIGGSVVINNGTIVATRDTRLTINPSSFVNKGKLAVDSTSEIDLTPAVTLASGSTLSVELAGSGVSGRFVFTGGVTLNGGSIEVATTSTGPGFLGYYKIMQYTGSIAGTGVSSLILPATVNNIAYTLDTSHDPGFIDIHRGFLGDANDDGIVNIDDFGLLSQNFGKPGGWGQANFFGDATVNINDFGAISQHFGQSILNPSAVATAGELAAFQSASTSFLAANGVPEPTSLALLGMGAVALLARRRRQA